MKGKVQIPGRKTLVNYPGVGKQGVKCNKRWSKMYQVKKEYWVSGSIYAVSKYVIKTQGYRTKTRLIMIQIHFFDFSKF